MTGPTWSYNRTTSISARRRENLRLCSVEGTNVSLEVRGGLREATDDYTFGFVMDDYALIGDEEDGPGELEDNVVEIGQCSISSFSFK